VETQYNLNTLVYIQKVRQSDKDCASSAVCRPTAKEFWLCRQIRVPRNKMTHPAPIFALSRDLLAHCLSHLPINELVAIVFISKMFTRELINESSKLIANSMGLDAEEVDSAFVEKLQNAAAYYPGLANTWAINEMRYFHNGYYLLEAIYFYRNYTPRNRHHDRSASIEFRAMLICADIELSTQDKYYQWFLHEQTNTLSVALLLRPCRIATQLLYGMSNSSFTVGCKAHVVNVKKRSAALVATESLPVGSWDGFRSFPFEFTALKPSVYRIDFQLSTAYNGLFLLRFSAADDSRPRWDCTDHICPYYVDVIPGRGRIREIIHDHEDSHDEDDDDYDGL